MSKIYSFILLILVILTLVSCEPISVDEPVEPITDEPTDVGPTPTCASISTFGQLTIANLNSKTGYENDATSITIYSGTCAIRDGANTLWCYNQQEKLDIDGVNLSAFPTPPPTTNNVLAAVEIRPDGMIFPTIDQNSIYPCVNNWNTRPLLSYDLCANPPGKNPESCAKDKPCYIVYQYYDNNWQVVGSAIPRLDGKWFADAYIKHFSIFALVEMPDPTRIDSPHELFLVVASDFLEDSLGNIFVAYYITDVTDDPSGQFSPDEYQHFLRFSNPDPSSITMDDTSNCSDLPLSDMFSCLFPIGDRIQVVIGVDGDITSHSIISLNKGNQVEFYSSSVEYYN